MDTIAPTGTRYDTQRSAALFEILTFFYRDLRKIRTVFLVCMALTIIVSFLPSKKYTSDAALLLRLGREYVYTPEVGDPNLSSPITYDREQTLLAESKILTSREVKLAVFDKLGVAQIYPKLAGLDAEKQRKAGLLAFENALDAELLKGSNLMQVSFTHADPAVAARVLGEVIDAYLRRRSSIFSTSSFASSEDDFVIRSIQLNVAEAKIAALKKNRNIRAFNEEQSLLLAQRNTLEMRLADARLALSQAQGRETSLSNSHAKLAGDVTLFTETQRSEALESARKQLLDLTLKERDLSAKFVDSNLSVQDVRQDIERTKDFIRDLEAHPPRTVRSGRSPALDTVDSDLFRAKAEIRQAEAGTTAVANQLQAIDRRLSTFASTEIDLAELERAKRLAESNYDIASKRLRDDLALEDLDRKRQSNVSIVQAPVLPLQGKSLQPIILLLGTFLSVCAALMTAFLSALLRDTFITPREAEHRLGLPMLTSIAKGAK